MFVKFYFYFLSFLFLNIKLLSIQPSKTQDTLKTQIVYTFTSEPFYKKLKIKKKTFKDSLNSLINIIQESQTQTQKLRSRKVISSKRNHNDNFLAIMYRNTHQDGNPQVEKL